MKELFSVYLPDSHKKFIVSWDEDRVRQFIQVHNLGDLKIYFRQYRKTFMGFLKCLFLRITKKSFIASPGVYEPFQNTVNIFTDILIYGIIDGKFGKCDISSQEFKTLFARAMASVLTHELGHVADRDYLLRVSYWWGIPKSYVDTVERLARNFAAEYTEELLKAFSVEEI